MATLKLKDINKIYDNKEIKPKLVVDNLVTIRGEISIRGDEVPIVLAKKIEFWETDEGKDKKYEASSEDKILYLNYSSLDFMLSSRIANVLHSHAGKSTARVKCTETSKIISLEQKVDINDVLLVELRGILNKECIFVKEKNGNGGV